MDLRTAWMLGVGLVFAAAIIGFAIVASLPPSHYASLSLDARTIPNSPVALGSDVSFTFTLHNQLGLTEGLDYSILWDNSTTVFGPKEIALTDSSSATITQSVTARARGLHKVYVVARSGSLEYSVFFPVNVT
jgi:uncharacterized protein (DUF58 family)